MKPSHARRQRPRQFRYVGMFDGDQSRHDRAFARAGGLEGFEKRLDPRPIPHAGGDDQRVIANVCLDMDIGRPGVGATSRDHLFLLGVEQTQQFFRILGRIALVAGDHANFAGIDGGFLIELLNQLRRKFDLGGVAREDQRVGAGLGGDLKRGLGTSWGGGLRRGLRRGLAPDALDGRFRSAGFRGKHLGNDRLQFDRIGDFQADDANGGIFFGGGGVEFFHQCFHAKHCLVGRTDEDAIVSGIGHDAGGGLGGFRFRFRRRQQFFDHARHLVGVGIDELEDADILGSIAGFIERSDNGLGPGELLVGHVEQKQIGGIVGNEERAGLCTSTDADGLAGFRVGDVLRGTAAAANDPLQDRDDRRSGGVLDRNDLEFSLVGGGLVDQVEHRFDATDIRQRVGDDHARAALERRDRPTGRHEANDRLGGIGGRDMFQRQDDRNELAGAELAGVIESPKNRRHRGHLRELTQPEESAFFAKNISLHRKNQIERIERLGVGVALGVKERQRALQRGIAKQGLVGCLGKTTNHFGIGHAGKLKFHGGKGLDDRRFFRFCSLRGVSLFGFGLLRDVFLGSVCLGGVLHRRRFFCFCNFRRGLFFDIGFRGDFFLGSVFLGSVCLGSVCLGSFLHRRRFFRFCDFRGRSGGRVALGCLDVGRCQQGQHTHNHQLGPEGQLARLSRRSHRFHGSHFLHGLHIENTPLPPVVGLGEDYSVRDSGADGVLAAAGILVAAGLAFGFL